MYGVLRHNEGLGTEMSHDHRADDATSLTTHNNGYLDKIRVLRKIRGFEFSLPCNEAETAGENSKQRAVRNNKQ